MFMRKELIVISAVWCPSCLVYKKYLKKIKEEYNIDYMVLDYDFDEDEVKPYEVGKKLPVMIVEENNKETSRLIGEKSYDEIIEFLKESGIV